MPSRWGKSSSKEAKKKTSKESFIDTFHRKFNIPSDSKLTSKSGGFRRRSSNTISEKSSKFRVVSRSTSPSKLVARCQSFNERPQPLPVPKSHSAIDRTDSGISISSKSRLYKSTNPSLFLSLSKLSCICYRSDPADVDGDVIPSSFSSECGSDDPVDSHQRSPLATDYESGNRTTVAGPNFSMMARNQPVMEIKSKYATKQANQVSPASSKRRNLSSHVSNLQVPCHGIFCNAADSSLSSPSRSPMRAFGTDLIINSAIKAYPPSLGSGHCSSLVQGRILVII